MSAEMRALLAKLSDAEQVQSLHTLEPTSNSKPPSKYSVWKSIRPYDRLIRTFPHRNDQAWSRNGMRSDSSARNWKSTWIFIGAMWLPQTLPLRNYDKNDKSLRLLF